MSKPDDNLMAKSKKRLLITLVPILAALAGLAYILLTPGLTPVIISNNNFQPMIVPTRQIQHMGTINMDSEADSQFVIYNRGGGILNIENVDTSCGCTVAKITKKRLMPGDATRLHVTIDTSLKVGPTKKCITVFSNDPKTPELKLLLTANVKPVMLKHDKIVPKDPLVLFKGDCAKCHVDKGQGKVGKELFIADCAMCHGLNADGKKDVAPSLVGNYHDEQFMASMRQIVTDGSPNKPTMPPFSKTHGGPLNDAEITSLMNYLRFQSHQIQTGAVEPVDEEECGGLEKAPVKF